MAFDSEKWALSFYGVVDERFAVETDMFQLHIHRKSGIKRLEVAKSEGVLDIYIPEDWNMEKYQCQEKLRRLLQTEVKWQAKIIFERLTKYYASRYGIPCERVELETRYNYIGRCDRDKQMIKYNPWVICSCDKQHIDYLVCHELAHFYLLGHSTEFWEIAERLYLGLDLNAQTTGDTIQKVRNEFANNMVLILLRYWGRYSYLKSFYSNGLVKHKTPLVIPKYVETPNGKKQTLFIQHLESNFGDNRHILPFTLHQKNE